jgi:3-hydroxyacyl-CoA dehydrogenase / 3-hydroxy-2-methylbutyryl-CoA dehydrogenase
MNGLVVLVTGGASGLGLACIKRFARQGARVIICDLPSSKGNEVVEQWSTISTLSDTDTHSIGKATVDTVKPQLTSTGQHGDLIKPKFFPADVTNEEQIQAMFEQIKQQYGKLDAVLNCAGIGIAVRTYNINKVRR